VCALARRHGIQTPAGDTAAAAEAAVRSALAAGPRGERFLRVLARHGLSFGGRSGVVLVRVPLKALVGVVVVAAATCSGPGAGGPPPGPAAPGGVAAPAGSARPAPGTGPPAARPGTGGRAGQARPGPSPASQPAVTIGWVGDTVPASTDIGLPADPNTLLQAVRGPLAGPDLMIGNLEGTLTDRPTTKCQRLPDKEHCFAFRSPPAYARLLADAGFDLMNLANNHSHDAGPAGLADTAQALAGAGLASTGQPGQVTVRRVRGVPVAVVGFAPYGWAAPLNDEAAVRALVGRARAVASIVLVAFHGGAEGAAASHVPAGREFAFGEDRGDLRRFARAAVDAGASAVLGSGPHVTRGMEVYRGRPIAYSAGNFLGYHVLSSAGPLGVGCLIRLSFSADGQWTSGLVVPISLDPAGVPSVDPGRRALDAIASLSTQDFGHTAVHLAPDGRISAG
jgi:poly-gamma-glutamate capsule biosynthesis protein CapA/YwtB (metallophosphatase superfamily)